MKAFLVMTARRLIDTEALAARTARVLRAGDCVCLSADLGIGKTAFARALVRELLNDPTADVPSPTFTLVQSYDGAMPVSHADLYRLRHADEWHELGLDDALDRGTLLIEWPDRAEGYLPRGRLDIKGRMAPDGARLWTFFGGARWMRRFAIREDM